ncbi:MAG: hypothetical protein FJ088_14955, partial [Deltaproteobacteria bacterium]|nr:hypothetical protein [Deltaproteobacteria bacterium]
MKNAVLLVEHPQIHSVGIIEHYVYAIKSHLEKEGYVFKPVESVPAWITGSDNECRDAGGRENLRRGIEKAVKEADERFFNNNDIAGAITILEKALALYMDHPGAAADKNELPDRIYSAGLSLVRLYLLAGKNDRAAIVRDYLLGLFPGRIPDISIVPPEVVDFFSEGEETGAGSCKLKISAHPKVSA